MFSTVVGFFVPHEGNNHRAQLLHHKNLFAIVLLFIITATVLFSVRKAAPTVLGIATDISIEALLQTTNQKRSEQGVAPLTISPELSAAAAAKATDMFAKDYWAHNAPDGTTPWVFFKNAGYNYIYAGENLAKDFDNSVGVVDGWMGSTSHRENMLNGKYDEVGFAVVNGTLNGQETTLVVEELGKRQGGGVVAVPVAQARVTVAPSRVPTKTPLPTTLPTQMPTIEPSPTTFAIANSVPQTFTVTPGQRLVAGITNNPLIDSATFTKRVSLSVLSVIVFAFTLDMLYIERKKLVRLVGHNSDHIIFLVGAMLLALVFGKGVVL